MKLYQFTYTDNQILSEAEISLRVTNFLALECESQGWASGYQFRQYQTPELLSDGKRNFFFEVIGDYSSSDSINFDEELKEAT